jgi:hypothetical protein
MKIELSNGAITASTTDEYKIDARAIDVAVHTTERDAEVNATFWDKERTMEEYISLRVNIKETLYEPPEDTGEASIPGLAGNLTQFLSLDQARDQVRALNSALAEAGDFVAIFKADPVEHSVDLDILAQTIGEHISCNPDEYDLAQDIAEALKAEFKGQSVHMRENEPVANHEAPTRISDLAGSRLEPGQ